MQRYLLLLFVFFSFELFGQFGVPEQIIPQDIYTESIQLADLNGDGYEDMLTTSPFLWYEGKGMGEFAQRHELGEGITPILPKVAISDFDQDGDLDILVAEKSSETLLWYENEGQGSFEEKHIISSTLEFVQDFAIDDWDKDGDMDILVTTANGLDGDENGQIISFENDGWGVFSFYATIVSSPERGYRKLFLADLTNDGYADIVVNHSDKGVLIFNSLGNGNYNTNQEVGQLNELALHETTSNFHLASFEAIFADFNKDGYLDIIPRFDNFKKIVWYENNQSGRFLASHLVHTDTYKLLEINVADLDDDNDMDIVFAGRNMAVLENKGTGFFWQETVIKNITSVYNVGEIILKDMDQDGHLDLLISDDISLVYWMEGNGNLLFSQSHSIIFRLEELLVGNRQNSYWEDINSDGFNDLVFFNEETSHLFWFENNGKGRFGLAKTLIPDLPKLYRPIIHFADINGDGYVDVIAGEDTSKGIAISYLNEGGGNFTQYQELELEGKIGLLGGIESEDLDKDGDLDLVLIPNSAYLNSQVLYAVNDGTGFFDISLLTNGLDLSFSQVLLGDLNNDGWKDLLLQSYQNLYWIKNIGGENFSTTIKIAGIENHSYRQVHLKDFDNDGYLDILSSIGGDYVANIYIQKNNQGINFKPYEIILESVHSIKDWMFKDLDQDTDEDLVVNVKTFEGGEDGNQWLWYENKGGNVLGGIAPIAFVASFWENTTTLLIEDMDYDGDNDLLLYDDSYEPRLFFSENFYDLKKTITGYVFLDNNENGVYDTGEFSLAAQPTILQPTANASFTNSEGKFYYAVYPGDYHLTYQASTLWERTSPHESYDITVTGEEVLPLHDFGFKPTRILPRVEPHLNSTPTRCSTLATYFLQYVNTGTTIANGTITLEVDELMELVSSNPEPDLVEGSQLTWFINNLPPTFENKVQLRFQMPSFSSMGEILETEASLQLFNENEELVYSKSTDHNSEVLCSYDPNDKLVRSNLLGQSESAYISDTLLYTIRFQNTGNDVAFNIRIEDELDKKLDWTTFHPITASHDYRTELNRETGLVTFYFDDIMLPDSTSNEPESHGFVLFGIASLPDVGDKTEVENTASIFFDFNPPIVTNTVSTVLIEQVETDIHDSILDVKYSIFIRPNPFSDYTTIEVEGLSPSGNYRLEVMDILGRKVRALTLEEGKARLERGKLESGVYFFRVLEEGNLEAIGGGKVLVK